MDHRLRLPGAGADIAVPGRVETPEFRTAPPSPDLVGREDSTTAEGAGFYDKRYQPAANPPESVEATVELSFDHAENHSDAPDGTTATSSTLDRGTQTEGSITPQPQSSDVSEKTRVIDPMVPDVPDPGDPAPPPPPPNISPFKQLLGWRLIVVEFW